MTFRINSLEQSRYDYLTLVCVDGGSDWSLADEKTAKPDWEDIATCFEGKTASRESKPLTPFSTLRAGHI